MELLTGGPRTGPRLLWYPRLSLVTTEPSLSHHHSVYNRLTELSPGGEAHQKGAESVQTEGPVVSSIQHKVWRPFLQIQVRGKRGGWNSRRTLTSPSRAHCLLGVVAPPPKRRAFILQKWLQPSEALPSGTSCRPPVEGALPAQIPATPPQRAQAEGEGLGKGAV